MERLVLLNQKVHRDIRVKPELVEAHGANERLIPVVLSEFQKLCIQYPILITKNNDTGGFVCVSVFGFEKGENLFWINNAWDAVYIPLNIARQPFFIGRENEIKGEQKDSYVICIDRESQSLDESGGELLFDKDGKETAYLEKMKAILATLLEGEKATQDFLEKLLSLELLTPVSLDIRFVNDESQRVEGSYTIDEKRLQNLSKDKVAELHALGYLAPIYAMIFSLGQFYPLINRKNAMLSKAGDWFKGAGS
ncbi:MAG: SapC family protein [Gammaproteobacteria bacterium]|nr:SapC family protein [Gammaproteobacteria bacterium]